MKIGYSVEGATDRALLTGLKRRWCPGAEMLEGHFRGTTGQSRHRELPRICEELALKGADVLVFLSDANDRPWRDVLREERSRFPAQRAAAAVIAVASRNVESWICADPNYVAGHCGMPASLLAVEDPKGPFEGAMAITRANRREPEIARIVEEAPLHSWLRNESFRNFYEQARDLSQRNGCQIENLLEKT